MSGLLLEVASGTGQHATHFARGLPDLRIQPTDVDPEHLRTLEARVAGSALPNLLAPLRLDVREMPWPVERAEVIYCANMVHIAPFAAAVALLRGAANTLAKGGHLLTYGPYRVGGRHTSPSNERFDASLRQRDPTWGVREIGELELEANRVGLVLDDAVDMPANNLLLVWTL
jgi:SAM-dependent methyltransferase